MRLGVVLAWFGVVGWGGVVFVVGVFGVGVGVVFGRITVTAATDMAVMTTICVTTCLRRFNMTSGGSLLSANLVWCFFGGVLVWLVEVELLLFLERLGVMADALCEICESGSSEFGTVSNISSKVSVSQILGMRFIVIFGLGRCNSILNHENPLPFEYVGSFTELTGVS